MKSWEKAGVENVLFLVVIYKFKVGIDSHSARGRPQAVTIWKLGRTVCVYSMVQKREKEKDSRYMDETSAPAAVTVYQICNISPAQVYLQHFPLLLHSIKIKHKQQELQN